MPDLFDDDFDAASPVPEAAAAASTTTNCFAMYSGPFALNHLLSRWGSPFRLAEHAYLLREEARALVVDDLPPLLGQLKFRRPEVEAMGGRGGGEVAAAGGVDEFVAEDLLRRNLLRLPRLRFLRA